MITDKHFIYYIIGIQSITLVSVNFSGQFLSTGFGREVTHEASKVTQAKAFWTLK